MAPKGKSKKKGGISLSALGAMAGPPASGSATSAPREEKKEVIEEKGSTGSKKVFEGLDPENPLLVPKWRFLIERGYIASIDYHVDGFGMNLIVRLPHWIEGVPQEHLQVSGRLAVQMLKDRGVLDKFGRLEKSLTKASARGEVASATQPKVEKKGAKPKKSLVQSDFEGDLERLEYKTRAAAVASNLGITAIRGRILSVFGRPPEGVSTIEGWWIGASAHQRLRLLMDANHLSVLQGQVQTYERAQALILDFPCPFRGALRPTKKGKEPAPVETGEGVLAEEKEEESS